MKTLHLIALLALLPLGLQAKTTYIPTYYNRILAIENGQIDSLSGRQHLLQLDSRDRLVSFAIAHQEVSPDLVKAIKQAKRAAGWTGVASGLMVGASTFSDVQLIRGKSRGYIVGAIEGQYASGGLAAASADAYAQARELKTLMVDLIVTNHSDKEIQITDMDQGLVWYVMPQKDIALPLLKGEECHFRISPAAHPDENVKYINVLTDSYLEKYTIALETDMYWYVPISDRAKQGLGFDCPMEEGYIKVNKESLRMNAIATDDFKAIKASLKQ
ncbi:MAG: hypothetical protein IJ219_05085 [Bacteroidaceae bacterium]|nr:hypothetical protein [Bacteroidaceae bacterium]